MITITIANENIEKKSGTKNGKEWSIREQAAVLEAPDRKQPVRLALGNNDPHKAGTYHLDLNKNLNISQFGSIQLNRNLELTPVPASK